MTVTRLKRKHRKNIARANNKQNIIKNLLRTPVLKNVDLEELKSRFSTAAPAKAEAGTSIRDTVKNAASAAVSTAPASTIRVASTLPVDFSRSSAADSASARGSRTR